MARLALEIVGPARTDMCRPTVTGVLNSYKVRTVEQLKVKMKLLQMRKGRKKDLVDGDSAAFPSTEEGVRTVRGGVPRGRHTALIACGAWLHTGWSKS